MKSTLLKTLAATSLVATTHADVQVMGASFKERGVNAPNGTIIANPGTVAATRGYLIMDDTVSGATPNKATYIEYGEIRNAGVVTRYYTVDTNFSDFRADAIGGDSGGKRIYGHMHAPVSVADVPNALIPFSGTVSGEFSFPRKLSFDHTVFQTGASDAVAGPQIIIASNVASTLRSVVSGSANPVNVPDKVFPNTGDEMVDTTAELVARLVKQGYVKNLGEAPQITSTFPDTIALADGDTRTLTVTLDPDVFPTGDDTFSGPVYQWYKNDVAIPTGIGPSLTITGGLASQPADGSGTYKVIVGNTLGSATSTNVVVTSVANQITTNLQSPVNIQGSNSATLSVVLAPGAVTPPTYQWFKATTAAPTTFNPIAGAAGTGASLTVTGGEPATGVGLYKVEITNSAGMIASSVATVNVSNVPMSFTTQMTSTIAVPFAGTALLAPVVVSNALPKVTGYQWMKATLAAPGSFTNVSAGDGGTAATLTVNGNNASPVGPGVYRLTISNGVDTPVLSSTCTVTTAP